MNTLAQLLLALHLCSEREKPQLLKLYHAHYREMLVDLRMKMAAPKSGRN